VCMGGDAGWTGIFSRVALPRSHPSCHVCACVFVFCALQSSILYSPDVDVVTITNLNIQWCVCVHVATFPGLRFLLCCLWSLAADC
jgi:hypothetical protein